MAEIILTPDIWVVYDDLVIPELYVETLPPLAYTSAEDKAKEYSEMEADAAIEEIYLIDNPGDNVEQPKPKKKKKKKTQHPPRV